MHKIYGFCYGVMKNDAKTMIEKYTAVVITEDGQEIAFYEHSDYNELKKFFTTEHKYKKYKAIYDDYDYEWVELLDENGNFIEVDNKGFKEALEKHNEMIDK
jgi:hypothetical protein